MAVNLANAFDKFDKGVKLSKKGSLDWEEKQDLKNLDIKVNDDAKKAFFSEKFVLKEGTSEKNLRFILTNFKPETKTIEWKENGIDYSVSVDDNSELAGILQTGLVVAGNDLRSDKQKRNKEDRTKAIDGELGGRTAAAHKAFIGRLPNSNKAGKESTNNGKKTENEKKTPKKEVKKNNDNGKKAKQEYSKETVPAGERIGVNQLDDASFTKEFRTLYGDDNTRTYEKMGVINGRTGVLTIELDANKEPLIIPLYGGYGKGVEFIRIRYKSKESGAEKVIPIRINKDENNTVDKNEIVKSIVDEIEKNEKAINDKNSIKTVTEGIGNFSINDITNPMIKKCVEEENIKFIYTNNQVILVVKKGDNPTAKVEAKNMLTEKGEFDNAKFNGILNENFSTYAADYLNRFYADELKINVIAASDGNEETNFENFVTLCDTYLDEIDKLSSGDELKDSKDKITQCKSELIDKKNYFKCKKILELMKNEFDNAGEGLDQGEKVRAKLRTLEPTRLTIPTIEKDAFGVINNVELRPSTRAKKGFKTPEQKKEYNDVVNNMATKIRMIDSNIQITVHELK